MGVPGDPVIPIHSSSELNALTAQVHQIAATLHKPQVISLAMPVDPAIKPVPPAPDEQPGWATSRRTRHSAGRSASQGPRQSGVFSAYPLYVATPQLLRYLGVDPATVAAGLDMVSPLSGDLTIENGASAETITKCIGSPAPGTHPLPRLP